MGIYGEIQEDFYAERTRILNAFGREPNRKVVLRLIGALAFRTHCPQFGHFQEELGRKFTDIDFATYPRFLKDILRVLTELGYKEDKSVTQLFSDSRLLFHDLSFNRHIDVFFNNLVFCHTVPFAGRLEADSETLPLAELLLEKMQIVKINEKDLIDTIMLLREHPIGDTDRETINAGVVTGLLANDWGFWRTVTANLRLVDQELGRYQRLEEEDRKIVRQRIAELQRRIEERPKSLRWKMRAAVGERVKWYRDVEELIDR
jgi:hypothetical protein